MKNKKWLLIPLLVIIVAVMWYVSSTQWTRDLEIKYVEFVNDNSNGKTDYSHYLYEITNNTNHTLRDISAVILVDDIGKDWKYEDVVVSKIRPGETIEYRLYIKDCEEAAEEQGERLGWGYSVDIMKIKYSK